jgi:hypothetical protein
MINKKEFTVTISFENGNVSSENDIFELAKNILNGITEYSNAHGLLKNNESIHENEVEVSIDGMFSLSSKL